MIGLLSLFFGIPAILLLLIFGIRKLNKKGFKKVAATITIALLLLVSYEIYSAIFPLDGFYKYVFETDLGTPFPEKAIIISKDAGFPDQHDKFEACCTIKLQNKDLLDLQKKFNSNIEFRSILASAQCDKIMSRYKKEDILFVHSDTISASKLCYLLFLNDNKTIVFSHVSW